MFLGGHTGVLAAEAILLAGQTAAASICWRQQLQLLWAGRRCLRSRVDETIVIVTTGTAKEVVNTLQDLDL